MSVRTNLAVLKHNLVRKYNNHCLLCPKRVKPAIQALIQTLFFRFAFQVIWLYLFFHHNTFWTSFLTVLPSTELNRSVCAKNNQNVSPLQDGIEVEGGCFASLRSVHRQCYLSAFIRRTECEIRCNSISNILFPPSHICKTVFLFFVVIILIYSETRFVMLCTLMHTAYLQKQS
jgi:hypothetical protein